MELANNFNYSTVKEKKTSINFELNFQYIIRCPYEIIHTYVYHILKKEEKKLNFSYRFTYFQIVARYNFTYVHTYDRRSE